MKNHHLWAVGMILMACGHCAIWRIFGVIIMIIWLILNFKDKSKT